jgi:phosphatidylserine/phosphatidylglycerophosphate/cardiolipin synthase-like enzyme
VVRTIVTALCGVVLTASAAACAGTVSQPGRRPGSATPPAAAPQPVATGRPATGGASPAPAGRGGSLRLLIEPQAGLGLVYRLITGARSSVDLTMYELADPTAEADLATDAARGVNVRVILDRHLEKARNAAAFGFLRRHGVHARWAPAGTTYHQKTLTIDHAASVIMTGNLVAADYSGTRDFAVVDTRRTDVAAIIATFDADFAGRAITPPDGSDLVWSPANAQSAMLSVIDGAAHTLAVEDEEMDDPAVTGALAAAARRGVDVTVTMTADPEWNQALAVLSRAGVHVRLYPDSGTALYIHAKAIVADAGRRGQRVLVGSQNFSVASLDYNRELGILTRDPAILTGIARTLAADHAGASRYSSPAAPLPGRSGSSGAWCTATASVYNAARNENNVYVRSNRPDTEATASADGYTHTYRSNGSGYALIYLNGPPPGARITVTVGGATCTTSD